MIHKETKWPVVWATTYNDLVQQLAREARLVSSKRGEIRDNESRIAKLKNTLRYEQQKRNGAVEERDAAQKRVETAVRETVKFQKQSDTAREELKALKKKLSDNAIPTRDVKSGRFKKRA